MNYLFTTRPPSGFTPTPKNVHTIKSSLCFGCGLKSSCIAEIHLNLFELTNDVLCYNTEAHMVVVACSSLSDDNTKQRSTTHYTPFPSPRRWSLSLGKPVDVHLCSSVAGGDGRWKWKWQKPAIVMLRTT